MLTSSECLKKFGPPRPENEPNYMVLWDVPQSINDAIPTLPNRIYCNKLMVVPLEKSFRAVIAAGCQDEVKTWDGCFNVRMKRGLNGLSLHSWGLAIDINAAWNQLGKIPTLSPKLVSCFTANGFLWGGTWKTRLDGMHFELKSI